MLSVVLQAPRLSFQEASVAFADLAFECRSNLLFEKALVQGILSRQIGRQFSGQGCLTPSVLEHCCSFLFHNDLCLFESQIVALLCLIEVS